jgi:hypothetical protein
MRVVRCLLFGRGGRRCGDVGRLSRGGREAAGLGLVLVPVVLDMIVAVVAVAAAAGELEEVLGDVLLWAVVRVLVETAGWRCLLVRCWDLAGLLCRYLTRMSRSLYCSLSILRPVEESDTALAV